MHEFRILFEAYQSKRDYENYKAGLTPAILYNIHKNKSASPVSPLDFFAESKARSSKAIKDPKVLREVLLPLFRQKHK